MESYGTNQRGTTETEGTHLLHPNEHRKRSNFSTFWDHRTDNQAPAHHDAGFLFDNSLLVSCVIQVFHLSVLVIIEHIFGRAVAHEVYVVVWSCVFESMQVLLMLTTVHTCITRIRNHFMTFTELVRVYFTTLVSFTGVYWICFHALSYDAFTFAAGLPQPSLQEGDMFSYFLTFFYFSIQTMTGLGFGDIAPAQVSSKVVASLQMLTNVVFNIGIFALAVHHFHTQIISTQPGTRRSRFGRCIKHVRSLHPCVDVVRRHVVRFVLFYSVMLQTINFVVLEVFLSRGVFGSHHQWGETSDDRALLLLGGIMQIVQLTFLMSMVLRMLRKAEGNQALALSWIMQSYLSTCLLFAGIYYTAYGWDGRSFSSSFRDLGPNKEATKSGIAILLQCIYFSFTVMSTTGYGDIFPIDNMARLCVVLQCLVSVAYQVVIFGLGTSRFVHQLNLHMRSPGGTPRVARRLRPPKFNL